MFVIDKSSWEIRNTKSTGRGVFAKKLIKGGSIIGDYIGKVIHPNEDTSDKYGMYNMWISPEILVYADPKSEGVHLINHSCEPNVAMYPHKGHILYYAQRTIFPGEQLTIHYLIDAPGKTEVAVMHPCRCKSRMCRGTLHATGSLNDENNWGDFKDIAEKGALKKLAIHSMLPRLSEYPKEVPDNSFNDIFGTVKLAPVRLQDTTIPDIKTIRSFIRGTGKRLSFPHMNLIVYGIQNRMIIASLLESKA